uniref:Ribosomal protein S12 n=1 Tax=Proteromonas lacertae TaxID=42746 RepID=E2E9Z2_PROLC|nr:ribosomal protein S12 [Proteromonas lacertae]YP_003795235.1 ribosomal protein S12 [Proteromonas lacertae]ADD46347.1 ribosomal protein S12 [Proteromonas lacertae]ADD46373.1 ribosomal protein S12 [Proteromonas lacertae]
MPTFSQLIKNPRIPKLHKIKAPLLINQPQKRAICFRIFIKNPKKPNSAKRKVANVGFIKKLSIFSFKKINVLTYIPGIGNNLQANSNVLFRGGRVKDLPGVRYHLIRGVLDFNGVKDRKNARSKYGTKKFNV